LAAEFSAIKVGKWIWSLFNCKTPKKSYNFDFCSFQSNNCPSQCNTTLYAVCIAR